MVAQCHGSRALQLGAGCSQHFLPMGIWGKETGNREDGTVPLCLGNFGVNLQFRVIWVIADELQFKCHEKCLVSVNVRSMVFWRGAEKPLYIK